MKLGKNYKVESDSMNITVSKRRLTKKDKREYWQAIGYFADPKNALKFIADLGVSETQMRDFKEVARKQDEVYALIDSLKLSRETLQSTTRGK